MTFDVLSSSLIAWELLTFFVLMALVLLAFFVSRRRRNEKEAGEILDARYANGEITQEEYLTVRDDITRANDA